jgi:GAF domain-containing protein
MRSDYWVARLKRAMTTENGSLTLTEDHLPGFAILSRMACSAQTSVSTRRRCTGCAIMTKRRRAKPITRSKTRSKTLAELKSENAKLRRELSEALEQQTATADVLGVISSTPGELTPVFEAMLANATRLCEAKFGNLLLYEGGGLRIVASHNVPSAFVEAHYRRGPFQPPPGGPLGEVITTKQTVHTADMAETQAYAERNPVTVVAVELGGIRTAVSVPLLKNNELIGIISIYRQEVRPFTDKQIALLSNFASQAVIAIENTRLFNELRQRTADLSESLEQQTATSEVLQIISGSPGELTPVFNAILSNATRICEAKFAYLYRFDGKAFHFAAEVGTPPELGDFQRRRGPFLPDAGGHLDRVMRTKQVSHSTDLAAEPARTAGARFGGARSYICVPMLKDEVLIGTISIYRQEVRPFAEKQIALVQSFAAQAVIAIENARLLNELRESLEQQTATSEVLQVISTSPGELDSVFQAMLAKATDICGAKFGRLLLCEGYGLRTVAEHNVPPTFVARRRGLFHPAPGGHLAEVIRTKQTIHVADLAATQLYIERHPTVVEAVELGGIRTGVTVPMLRENELIGIISIFRQEVRPFTDKQIALVQNFAAQAVIAIENARLLNELRQRTSDLSEALEQQTATSEVLKVISSSPGDLRPVFQAMLENATRICEADFGVLNLHENGVLRMGAMHNVPPIFAEFLQGQRAYQPLQGSLLDRVMRTKQTTHAADNKAEGLGRAATLGGARSIVIVPMLKDEALIGTITIYRQEVRPFTDKQIALVQNFAAQAVIAIENTRLLNELRESLEQQTATAEVLKVINSSTGALEPVFDVMLENATRICEAELGVLFRYDGALVHPSALRGASRELAEFYSRRGSFQPTPGTALDRLLKTREVIHLADASADDVPNAPARFAGARSFIAVPCLRMMY